MKTFTYLKIFTWSVDIFNVLLTIFNQLLTIFVYIFIEYFSNELVFILLPSVGKELLKRKVEK